MKISTIIVLSALLPCVMLTSCATGYGKSGLFTNGYDEKQLSADAYRVEFKGNEATSLQSTYEYAMRRSAELTLAKGYEYFVVTDKKTVMINSSFDTAYGMRTMILPDSILKIKFVKSKTANAYDAKKILARQV